MLSHIVVLIYGLVRCPGKLSSHNIMSFLPFGTILTICSNYFLFMFNVDKSAITFKPSRNEELYHFLIFIKISCTFCSLV